jgi:hypothetical protein
MEKTSPKRRPRLTTAVRLFDLRLASNRFVFAASTIALVGVGAFHALLGDSAEAVVSIGLEAAFSVFLSWAMARELDPDRPASAMAAGVAGFLVFLMGPTNLGAVAALLFAARVLGRTPGPPPTNFDLIWLPALAAYTARSAGGFLAGVALAVALGWDAEPPTRRRQLLSAAAALLLAVGLATLRDTLQPRPVSPTPWQWGILSAALLSLPWLRIPPPHSVDDWFGKPLSHRRLLRARALAVAAGALTAAWLGGLAATALVGLWAALIGIAVVRAARREASPDASGETPASSREPDRSPPRR